jgi:hypothetical protein
MGSEMGDWLRLARRPSVVRRAVKTALFVGAILIAINHGDAILRGDVPPGRLARIGLTVLVPYLVSTFSAVGALREMERGGRERSGSDRRPAGQRAVKAAQKAPRSKR